MFSCPSPSLKRKRVVDADSEARLRSVYSIFYLSRIVADINTRHTSESPERDIEPLSDPPEIRIVDYDESQPKETLPVYHPPGVQPWCQNRQRVFDRWIQGHKERERAAGRPIPRSELYFLRKTAVYKTFKPDHYFQDALRQLPPSSQDLTAHLFRILMMSFEANKDRRNAVQHEYTSLIYLLLCQCHGIITATDRDVCDLKRLQELVSMSRDLVGAMSCLLELEEQIREKVNASWDAESAEQVDLDLDLELD